MKFGEGNNQNSNLVLFVVTLVFLASFIFLGMSKRAPESVSFGQIKLGEAIFNLEIADSLSERARGLSYREELPEENVLLFIFENEERHGIWMKDMYFAIDIVWLDKNKRIIHIEKNISPKTFPKVFRPTSNSSYVVETNSGIVEKNNIKIGDLVEFSIL